MAEVSILVRAKDGFSAVFSSLGKGMKTIGSGAMAIGKTIAQGFAIATAATGALFAAGTKLVGMYRQQEEAEAKLQAALTATGYAAGMTKTEMVAHAEQLQRTTGVADDVIISTQGMIASFKNISGEAFNRTTQAVLDFAASQKKAGAETAEVESRSMMLARALDNPIANLSMLTRVGITFTEQEKEQIQAMQEAGNMAGAQDVILSKLEGRFGGTAEAMNKANMGVKDFKNILGDLGEQVGKAIVDSADFGGVMEMVNDTLRDLAESGYIELWAEKVKAAIDSMMPVVGKVITGLAKIGSVVKTGIQKTAAFAGGFSGAQGGLGARFSAGAFAAGNVAVENAKQAAEDRERISQIKARKAAEQQAQIEKERAEMNSAKAVEATTEAEQVNTEAKEEQAAAAEEVAAVEEHALDLAEQDLEVAKEKLDTVKEIGEVAKAQAAAVETLQGAKAESRFGQYDLSAGAIQSSATNTGLGMSLAASAEADRISKIIKALQGDGGGDQIKYLAQIAEATKVTSETIAAATSLG
jgi:hypothetical protein